MLFASIVDDPSARPDEFPTEDLQEAERWRLFSIIEELVKWENSNSPLVLEAAKNEILRATNDSPPSALDPFCGGGSIPLEAQRLGLDSHGSDLNPVAVLITKALVELPSRFPDLAPVRSEKGERMSASGWKGARGMAEDVRHYGTWMRDEARKRIGHLFPSVQLPKEYGGGAAPVIAWLWARTVICPNPACGARMPLMRSFWLCTKKGRETWLEPLIDESKKSVSFEVRSGKGKPGESPKIGRGAKFRCLVCEQVADDQHIKDEGMAGRMGAQLTAIVAEGDRRRIYLPGISEHLAVATSAVPSWAPEEELPYEPRAIWCTLYGLKRYRDLFTPRQLVALTTFVDLIGEVHEEIHRDAVSVGLSDDDVPLEAGGEGARAYADAISTYLAFAVDKGANYWSTICSWHIAAEKMMSTFARQALPMVWDYTEANPFSGSSGNFMLGIEQAANSLANAPCTPRGEAKQLDAASAVNGISSPLISTDPPYYDNIGYADLSDYFYVWLRRALKKQYPSLFSTLLTPKDQELVANPYRFGGDRLKAETFFERGLSAVFDHIAAQQNRDFPLTIFYAFKQSETDEDLGGGSFQASTGWETMLEAVLGAGLTVNGTWPMRTELTGSLKKDVGALASSIVLVCRQRDSEASLATRKEFSGALRNELPDALRKLQHGNVAPVDLAQAAVGPGMAIFSRYAKVVEADGQPMRVRTALGLINQVLDEVLAEQEGDYDPSTRWAVAWFEQHGMQSGKFGDAETLSKAKNTSVHGLVEDGILEAKGGKVRLLSRGELTPTWDPTTDTRLTIWEVCQYLVQSLITDGETSAAVLLRRVGPDHGQAARDLSYRLHAVCDRKKWSAEARPYNALVVAWPEIVRLAGADMPEQTTAF